MYIIYNSTPSPLQDYSECANKYRAPQKSRKLVLETSDRNNNIACNAVKYMQVPHPLPCSCVLARGLASTLWASVLMLAGRLAFGGRLFCRAVSRFWVLFKLEARRLMAGDERGGPGSGVTTKEGDNWINVRAYKFICGFHYYFQFQYHHTKSCK